MPCYPFRIDARKLLAEALRLSDEERAALAGELIQSLDTGVDADAEATWCAEIRARLDRVDAGTATTISWSDARRRIHVAARRVSEPGSQWLNSEAAVGSRLTATSPANGAPPRCRG